MRGIYGREYILHIILEFITYFVRTIVWRVTTKTDSQDVFETPTFDPLREYK